VFRPIILAWPLQISPFSPLFLKMSANALGCAQLSWKPTNRHYYRKMSTLKNQPLEDSSVTNKRKGPFDDSS
jgi:hypothetical protein